MLQRRVKTRGFVTLLILTLIAAVGWGQQPVDPAAAPARFDNHRVVRAQIQSEEDMATMREISPDIWSHGEGIGPVDYRVPPEKLADLDASGIEYVVLIENVQQLIDEERSYQPPTDGEWFNDYRDFNTILARMDELAAMNPEIAQVAEIGLSLEGRPIKALRITGPGGGDKPAVVYNYLQHAREWITPMAGMFMAEELITQYGVDPALTALTDSVEFYIIPVSNPDGYVYSWTTNRMWRKNRRDNGNGTWGVDMNRNWSVGWGGEGSSGDTNSEIYRGTAPFSEPETQVLRDLMLGLPNVAGHIDIHSYSQLVLQPWGWTGQLPPDHDVLDYVGGLMNDAMMAVHGEVYVHGPTYSTIYPASGVAGDWAYGELGALNYGYELRDRGQYGFLLPASQIVPASEESMAGAIALAQWFGTRLNFEFPNGLPEFVEPGMETMIELDILGVNGGVYQEGTGTLWTRLGFAGDFAPQDLVPMGGDRFEATLPAADCGEFIQYYFSAESTDGSQEYSPVGAPLERYETQSLIREILFADDFETDTGWSVENINLSDGPWGRAIPVNGGRGDPPADFDGSGRCYVTDNASGNSDVDGGPTLLTSPVINLAGQDAVVRYARWFYNDDNDIDRFTVEVSNDDGVNWTTVEETGHEGRWVRSEFTVSDFVTPTDTVRVRFGAVDNPNDSVTEAGLDAFEVVIVSCGEDVMRLDVGPLVAGENGQFDVTNGHPDTRTYLAYSITGLGNTYVPSLNVTLDLNRPKQAGDRVTTDGTGAATWNLPIPDAAQGRTVWFQACQFENVSNVVEARVN